MVQAEGEPGSPALLGRRRERRLRCGRRETRGEGGAQAPRREGKTASPSHGFGGGKRLLVDLSTAGDPPPPTSQEGDARCRGRTRVSGCIALVSGGRPAPGVREGDSKLIFRRDKISLDLVGAPQVERKTQVA